MPDLECSTMRSDYRNESTRACAQGRDGDKWRVRLLHVCQHAGNV